MLHVSHIKIRVPHGHTDATLFAHLALIITTGNAAFASIFPLILEEKLNGPTYVGLYYSIISFICIAASIISTRLFAQFSKIVIARVVLFTATIVIFAMNFAESVWHLGFLDVPRAISIMFSYIVLSLFIRDFSVTNKLAESQGHYYFFSSLGWVLGPLLGGFVAEQFNKEAVFNLVSSVMLASILYFELHGIRARHPHVNNNQNEQKSITGLSKNIVDYFKQPSLRKVFWVSFGFNFWCALRGTYMPLAIVAFGYGEKTVGLLMALGMLPCVLIEKYAVRVASRDGARTYIVAGFWYLACFISLFYFLREFPLSVLTLFVLANIGAALIEPLKSIYFFEVVKKHDAERFWGIYNIAEYAAYLIAPFLATFFLAFSPKISSLWAFVAGCMIIFSLGSLTLEKKLKK